VNKALLDTDMLSEIGKGIDQTVVRNAIAYRKAFGRYTMSAVTVMEVIRGHQKRQASGRIAGFLASIALEEVIPFNQPAAELAGRIAGDLESTGTPIGMADTIIAAIAVYRGLELVTGNTTHFQYIQNLGYPLMLVNWRQ
jgi:tRNA(fMet)-specific endonuclease VapC